MFLSSSIINPYNETNLAYLFWEEDFKAGKAYIEETVCYCCSQAESCSLGCRCWEDCEVNEDFDNDNETHIQRPCEYKKGHRGKHLHYIGIHQESGIMTNLHPIFWENNE